MTRSIDDITRDWLCAIPDMRGHYANELIQAQRAEIERLREEVVTFGIIWAVQYAEHQGLPRGSLHPIHYDMLKRNGARMDDFTRMEAA